MHLASSLSYQLTLRPRCPNNACWFTVGVPVALGTSAPDLASPMSSHRFRRMPWRSGCGLQTTPRPSCTPWCGPRTLQLSYTRDVQRPTTRASWPSDLPGRMPHLGPGLQWCAALFAWICTPDTTGWRHILQLLPYSYS